MQRSNFAIKLISIVLFLAVGSYIGVYIYNSAANPLTTASAVEVTSEKSIPVEGYIVRSEEIIPGSYTNLSAIAGEGEKVASGEPVAAVYNSESALKSATELMSLEVEIEQLTKALAVQNGDSADAGASDAVAALSAAVRAGDFSKLESAISGVSVNVFKDSSSSMEERLANLKGEYSRLSGQALSDVTYVTAPGAGVYASVSDGLEKVAPEDLLDCLPSELAQLFSGADAVSPGCPGKLVYGTRWYFAVIMAAEDTGHITEGKSVTLNFTKTYSKTLTMRIENISEPENGYCTVVFSSGKNMSDIVAMRSASAEVVYESNTGLCVPKESLHLDDEGSFIYVVSGLRAEVVYVNIVSQMNEYYVVTSDDVALQRGAEVIVKAKGLYDGKVIR